MLVKGILAHGGGSLARLPCLVVPTFLLARRHIQVPLWIPRGDGSRDPEAHLERGDIWEPTNYTSPFREEGLVSRGWMEDWSIQSHGSMEG
jgi:hypothetical protein